MYVFFKSHCVCVLVRTKVCTVCKYHKSKKEKETEKNKFNFIIALLNSHIEVHIIFNTFTGRFVYLLCFSMNSQAPHCPPQCSNRDLFYFILLFSQVRSVQGVVSVGEEMWCSTNHNPINKNTEEKNPTSANTAQRSLV